MYSVVSRVDKIYLIVNLKYVLPPFFKLVLHLGARLAMECCLEEFVSSDWLKVSVGWGKVVFFCLGSIHFGILKINEVDLF